MTNTKLRRSALWFTSNPLTFNINKTEQLVFFMCNLEINEENHSVKILSVFWILS